MLFNLGMPSEEKELYTLYSNMSKIIFSKYYKKALMDYNLN